MARDTSLVCTKRVRSVCSVGALASATATASRVTAEGSASRSAVASGCEGSPSASWWIAAQSRRGRS
jgi:hypothetical protein